MCLQRLPDVLHVRKRHRLDLQFAPRARKRRQMVRPWVFIVCGLWVDGLGGGPSKVDGAAPGCGGEEELALYGGGVFGGVRAWGLVGVEEDIAAMSGCGSCEFLGGRVGRGEGSLAKYGTSQSAHMSGSSV